MLRTFSEDVGARFKKGDTREYPAGTWKQIAYNAGKELEAITFDPTDTAGHSDRPAFVKHEVGATKRPRKN
jgi:hypothetical protein